MREVFRPYFPAFEEFAAVSFSKFWFLGNFFSRQIGKKNFEAIFGSLWPCQRQNLWLQLGKMKVI